MHIPLIIAILALLVLVLLPVLDRSSDTEINGMGIRSYVTRIARWAKE